MGVVHKLREDVISFIIDQKKKNPTIGVRQLAAQTSEKFQIKVSKSSVSTTLKNASLSSSVGRRSVNSTKTEKFSIPLSAKKEISKRMEKFGFAGATRAEDEAKTDKDKEADKQKVSPQPQINEEKTQKKESPKSKASPVMQAPQTEEKALPLPVKETESAIIGGSAKDRNFEKHIEGLRDQRKNQCTPLSKGAGYIFLKAAQWEVLSRPLLSKLLKKHFSDTLSGSFDAASELFLFLRSAGVETFDKSLNYHKDGLWLLNRLCGTVSDDKEVQERLEKLFEWEKSIGDPAASNIAMEYVLEKKHILSEVAAFKLFLEDGSTLNLNAALASFGVDFSEQTSPRETFPIDKSMTWLSNYLISNNQRLVFHVVPGAKKFNKAFYDIITVFENFPKRRFLKVAVLNENHKTLAEFSTIPTLKRLFSIGVSPRQREFDMLTKSTKWVERQPYYHQGTNSIIYFTETKTDCMATQFDEKIEDFRVVTIWRNRENSPCWAILTNDIAHEGKEIVEAYISRWPYFDSYGRESSETKSSDKNTTQKSGNIKFSGIFLDFIETLKEHCQKHFFPQNDSNNINDYIATIYEYSGSVYETKTSITVLLEVPQSAANRGDIEYAVKRINERHIFDYYGRKLWLEV